MDAYQVLGIKHGTLRTKEDMDKLRVKVKELYKSYCKKSREADAKKVEKAFEIVKQKFRDSQKKDGTDTKKAASASGADPSKASAVSSQASTASSGTARKRGANELTPENVKRQALIQTKLMQKRTVPQQEDPEAVRRREAIRQRLAEKRGGTAAGESADAGAGSDKPTPATSSQAPAPSIGADEEIAVVEESGGASGSNYHPSAQYPTVQPAPGSRLTSSLLLRPKRATVGVGARTHQSRRSGRSAVLICSSCGGSIERQHFKFCSADEEQFVCPQCRIRGMDPFNSVVEGHGGILKFAFLQPPIVEKEVYHEATFSFKRDFKKLKEWRKAGYSVEVRMCTTQDYKTYHMWPQTFQMQINKRLAIDVKPPEKVGEKRRDAPKNVSANLKPGINDFHVHVKDTNVQRLAFALVRTKQQAPREICKSVPVVVPEECKQKISNALFHSMLDGSAQEVQFSVSDRIGLECPITMMRMKTPARGRKCQHLQCFDLAAFLQTNQKIGVFNKRWACPVCDIDLKSSKDMFIDTYVMEIIAKAERDVVEVAFDQNGDWSVSARAEPGSDEEPAPAENELQDMPEGTPGPSPGLDEGDISADDGDVASPTDAPPSTSPPEASPLEGSPPADSSLQGSPPAGSPSAGSDLEPVEPAADVPPSEAVEKKAQASPAPVPPPDYIDPMDENHYVVVELPKPMGINFEANVPYGGVFIQGFEAEGAAAKHGRLKPRDQLVGVGGQDVNGKAFDECIDCIVADSGDLTKLTMFRGKATDLYGKFGATEDWIKDFLKGVESGKIKPAPPVEERTGKNRLSMPASDDSAGSEDEDDDAVFSDDDSSSVDDDGFSIPERIASCITGEGLTEDLQKCIQSLPELSFEGPPKRLSADGMLPKCIAKACINGNADAWASESDKKQWRRTARKQLADAANLRVDRLEAKEREKQENERQAALAALRRSQEEKARDQHGKFDGPLLKVEPSRIKFDANRQAQLHVKNLTSGFVAFKIKTSAPQSILVEPTAGTLSKGGQMTVQIVSTERQSFIASQELKFLVQSAAVPPGPPLTREKWAELPPGSIQEFTVLGKL